MFFTRVPGTVCRKLLRVTAVVAAVGGVSAISAPAEAEVVPVAAVARVAPVGKVAPAAKVVVIGVPGLTWEAVKASPELTALVGEAQVGSITVKTAGPVTCPIDGWLTISAGARAWGSGPGEACGALPAITGGEVAGWRAYANRQAEHHTGARIGRLGEIAQAAETGHAGRPSEAGRGGEAGRAGESRESARAGDSGESRESGRPGESGESGRRGRAGESGEAGRGVRAGESGGSGRGGGSGRAGQLVCGFGAGAAIALARADGSVANWRPEFDAARLASNSCGAAIVDAGALLGQEDAGALAGHGDAGALAGRREAGALAGQEGGGALAGREGGGALAGHGDAGAVAGQEGGGAWAGHGDAGAVAGREGGGALAGHRDAGRRIAELVARVKGAGGRVLLVGIGQQSAEARRELLVAMQFAPEGGSGWLTSASTRRPGLIQLSDITATIVHERTPGTSDLSGVDNAGPLDGSPIRATGDRSSDVGAVIENRLDFNQRFEQQRPRLIAVSLTILAAELLALAWFWIKRSPRSRRTFVFTLLVQCGFFVSVFLSTLTFWWRWPAPGFSLYCVVLGGSVILAGLAQCVLKRDAFLGIALAAYLTLLLDGVLGTPLQFGSMFTDGPITGGRFYGFGNSTFATLAVAALVTAGAVAQRLINKSRAQAAIAVLAIGGAAIVVDGWPGWGTDFGGIIALTPAVLLMAWLTWRGNISLRALIGEGLAGLLAVSAVAFADYSRPPEARTHFGAFVARFLDGDASELLIRKLQAAAHPFTGIGGWAMLAGVVLWMVATVLPGRVPFPAYRTFYNKLPMARPTLLALSTCGLIGMLLNDAGVALPAIMIGFALPLLAAHLLATPSRAPLDAHPTTDHL
ncbi:hypothetical protein GCM10009804_58920 [Kribbella hippodromi]|uniref:Uncharacterized protein n=1 Tax=Kribbella hippodromi TaxID=434347 RepID=A0ABP4PXI6_9ACTN